MNLEPQAPTLITCTPGPSYFGVADLHSHHISEVPDEKRTVNQHQLLVQTIEQAGTKAVNLQELQGHPNSVFTKDTAVCTPKGFIRVRMGLPSRESEEIWMAESLERIGIPCIGVIEAPGTVEGGDVILANDVAFIGQSSRTNSAGLQQLSLLLSSHGYEIRTTLVPSLFLHLGGAMTLLTPDTILCVNGLLPEWMFKGFQRIEVPHTGFISGNVIPLGERQVIADQSNTAAIKALQHHGFTVYPLDLSEFVKGTGGPSCMILQAID